MSKFNNEIKQSQIFRKCRSYLLVKDKVKNIDNFFLETPKKNREPVLDTSTKYNLLIFWASWCAPCRKEIPELKKIFAGYHNKELSFSSISLDNNVSRWNKALEIEKMPWKQFIINDSTKNKLDIIVNLSSIPLIVLLDNKGNIIMREMGFDETSPTALMETIKKHLD
jgi:thiol-disulfide isomerase/thioredoxin